MLLPAACDRRPDGPSVSLWYVARRLGREDRSEATILNQVRLLHANESFPNPLPHFRRDGSRIAGIVGSSRWARPAVDAWFDGFLPPVALTVPDEALAARHADALDVRALEIAA